MNITKTNNKNEVLDYLEKLSTEEKKVLSQIRNQILSTTHGIKEKLSRGVPFFYYMGKRLVGFRSSKTHLSFFIMEGNVLKNLRNKLNGYDVSSTVIHFNKAEPLPENIIKMLVLARIKEIEMILSKKQSKILKY